MKLSELEKYSDWVKMWSGRCSLNSCSRMGEMWTCRKILISGKPVYSGPVIFIVKNGVADCWARQKDKDDLGARLIKAVRSDPSKIKIMAGSLKANAKKVFAFIDKNKKADLKTCDNFWKILTNYYKPHLSVKYTADYLSDQESKKYLATLKNARVFAEPVFEKQEKFISEFAGQIAKEAKLKKELILAATAEELTGFLGHRSKLPSAKVLKKRAGQAVLILSKGKLELLSGSKAVAQVSKIVLPKTGLINGTAAYEGKAIGRVRIVLHPANFKGVFNQGDILVTGMTRPEFLAYFKKAGAVITDSGGALCHAAITARELKKPCLIATGNATKILKNGVKVKVDASRGTVLIIK